jgi:uncharacterized protein (DUF2147 family)
MVIFSRMLLPAALLAVGMFLGGAAAASDPGMSGWWIDDTSRAAILVAPCAEGLCGTIAWLKEPLDPKTGSPKLDVHNPTAALRDTPLCGLKILWGFQSDGPSHWTDGRVYDPESGNTYSAEASLGEHETLKLHGYILLPLIGRTKIFMRPSEPLKSCLAS